MAPLLSRLWGSDLAATVLFSWAAECATNCIVPSWQWRSHDLTSTALNLSGALLAGLASGVAHAHATYSPTVRLAGLFQGGFVGIWTNFAFLSEHGAELAWGGAQEKPAFSQGAAFLLTSLAGGLGCNWLGFRLGRGSAGLGALATRLSTGLALPRALVALVAACVLRAFLSATGSPLFPRGFVADPTNPEFQGLATHAFRDWKELVVGLGFAALAIVTGDRVGALFGASVSSGVPWATTVCNTLALAVVAVSYYIKESFPQLVRNVLFVKLLSSFCGGLSAFGGTCDEVVGLLQGCHHRSAALHLGTAALSSLLFCRLLLAHHVRFRVLESAATKIATLFRRRSARRRLALLRTVS